MYPPLFNQSLNILLLYYKQHGVAHWDKYPKLSTPTKMTSGISIISHMHAHNQKNQNQPNEKVKNPTQHPTAEQKRVCV